MKTSLRCVCISRKIRSLLIFSLQIKTVQFTNKIWVTFSITKITIGYKKQQFLLVSVCLLLSLVGDLFCIGENNLKTIGVSFIENWLWVSYKIVRPPDHKKKVLKQFLTKFSALSILVKLYLSCQLVFFALI